MVSAAWVSSVAAVSAILRRLLEIRIHRARLRIDQMPVAVVLQLRLRLAVSAEIFPA